MPLHPLSAPASASIPDGQASLLDARPVSRPLQGRNLGLVCEDHSSEAARRFERASRALGAQVVHIRPSAAGLQNEATVAQTARLLGRLYDAIDCEGLPTTTVAAIRSHAGVPVYQDLGRANAVTPSQGQSGLFDQDAPDVLELQKWLAGQLA